jgi:hypothetical protein
MGWSYLVRDFLACLFWLLFFFFEDIEFWGDFDFFEDFLEGFSELERALGGAPSAWDAPPCDPLELAKAGNFSVFF